MSFLFTDHGASANSRRSFFEKGAAAVATGLAITYPSAANAYKVPDLPYAFEALEPYIDAPTMKIHHDKHHATYVANINKATEGQEEKRKLCNNAKVCTSSPWSLTFNFKRHPKTFLQQSWISWRML